jgi:hypothetical protein
MEKLEGGVPAFACGCFVRWILKRSVAVTFDQLKPSGSSASDSGEEFLARGGHGDLRNTLSSRPDTSLSTSNRLTRSMAGFEFKCARHLSKSSSDEEVEAFLLSPLVPGAGDAVMHVSPHDVGAGEYCTAADACSLIKVSARVTGVVLSGAAAIVRAPPGLRRRRRFSPAKACCEGQGSCGAEIPRVRTRRDWSVVPCMLIW